MEVSAIIDITGSGCIKIIKVRNVVRKFMCAEFLKTNTRISKFRPEVVIRSWFGLAHE